MSARNEMAFDGLYRVTINKHERETVVNPLKTGWKEREGEEGEAWLMNGEEETPHALKQGVGLFLQVQDSLLRKYGGMGDVFMKLGKIRDSGREARQG